MKNSEHPMADLFTLLKSLDGKLFNDYRKLADRAFYHTRYSIRFVHIQGSPGAYPASVCHLRLGTAELGITGEYLSNAARKLATADYLLRAFTTGVSTCARQNRGALGSGSFQPLFLPPQVLERNVVTLDKNEVRIAFHVSLPGSHDNRILGREAVKMFDPELHGIVHTLEKAVSETFRLQEHCEVVEDMMSLQDRLSHYGLVAFVGDGALLARESGVSEGPLRKGAIPFQAPDQLAVEVELPNAGRVRGLGLRPGVNVLIGGGFHGKSTLLNALAMGVYPHLPGDGRERVVTHSQAVLVCAEEGRAVTGLDISGFIDTLPGNVDTATFSTQNASGSTSEAAAIVEAVLAGAKLLLIDEDSSATNFLIKDRNMRKLIPEDTITPLFDRVQELHEGFGISTLIVVGGSSEYLGVAKEVVGMREYLPVYMTDQLENLKLPKPLRPKTPLALTDRRQVLSENFDPSYHARRLDKNIPVRIKPLRLQERVLEYGNEKLDLTRLSALVDPQQVSALGYALLLAGKRLKDERLSPSDLAAMLERLIEEEGLGTLSKAVNDTVFLARPRRLELAGAINRLRNLKVNIDKS